MVNNLSENRAFEEYEIWAYSHIYIQGGGKIICFCLPYGKYYDSTMPYLFLNKLGFSTETTTATAMTIERSTRISGEEILFGDFAMYLFCTPYMCTLKWLNITFNLWYCGFGSFADRYTKSVVVTCISDQAIR